MAIQKLTIIGSRKITTAERNDLYRIAHYAVKRKIEVITGGALGSDHAAVVGANHSMDVHGLGYLQVWLPWDGFMGYTVDGIHHFVLDDFMARFAYNTLLDNGVSWINRVGPAVQALHCRNVYQILTADYSQTDAVVYCADHTKQGKVKGGTGIAVHLAWSLGIPTFNIRIPEERIALQRYLQAA